MLYVVCGDQGSGKTLWAVDWMVRDAMRGRKVFSNVRLLPSCPAFAAVGYMDDEDQGCVFRPQMLGQNYEAYWHYVPPGSLVVIDEADLYFDCGDYSKIAEEAKWYHKQLRKRDTDVIFLVQNVQNLWVRLRRLCGLFLVCEWNCMTQPLFRHLPRAWSRFFRSSYRAYPFDRFSHVEDGFMSYMRASRMFGWYDTKQVLGKSFGGAL